MKIKDLMTSDARSCGPSDRLITVIRWMDEAACGALPVLEDGRVVAMVTDRDICLGLARRNARPAGMTVRQVMSSPPLHTIGEEETADRALQLMRRWKVRRLPVVDQSDALRGIVSMNDIVRSIGEPGLSGPSEADTVRTLRAICERQRRAPGGDWVSRPALRRPEVLEH